MKILALQTGFRLTTGGARVDFELLSALARLGHAIRVIMPSVNRGDPVPLGCSVCYIPSRGLRFPHSLGLVSLPWILKETRRYKPDILRDHSPYTFGLASLACGSLLGVPVVASFYHSESGAAQTWTQQHLYHRYAHVVTTSRFSLSQLGALNKDILGKASYVYIGIGSEFEPQEIKIKLWRSKHQLPLEGPIFSTAGALIMRKNHAFLIEVMDRWVSEGRSGSLVIVGEGPERTALRADIVRRSLSERIFLWDYLSREDYLALLNISTSFLFPSVMEGFGLAPAEAMACGTPAIVSDRGSLPEVVSQGTIGFVLPVDRGTDLWLEAMSALSDHPELRFQMSQVAIADMRARFNWDRAGQETADLYQEIVRQCKEMG